MPEASTPSAEFLTEEEERQVLDARRAKGETTGNDTPDTSVGAIGERLACRYLWRQGFRILERNYRGGRGEIDIVAEKRECIHFVEVKTSAATSGGHPEERVDAKKQGLLREAARHYLDAFAEAPPGGTQFDVVALTVDKKGRAIEQALIEDAF